MSCIIKPLMNKDYLPSRQFVSRVIAIAIILAVIFGIYEAARFFGSKSKLGSKSNLVAQGLISSQKDSNNNGFADWEESLYGLDPTKNGPENKTFILARQAILAKQNPSGFKDGPLTESETLSRDFFTIIMSLQQSGNLDEDSIQAVSEAIGKKVVVEPIPDIYTRKSVRVVESNSTTISNYYAAYMKLLVLYDGKNIGDELVFINQGLENNDPKAIEMIKSIAIAYKGMGRDLIKVPVPNTLVNIHISLANNYEKVGQTIDGLTNLLTDPLTGIKSFINYKKYLDALVNDIDLLSNS